MTELHDLQGQMVWRLSKANEKDVEEKYTVRACLVQEKPKTYIVGICDLQIDIRTRDLPKTRQVGSGSSTPHSNSTRWRNERSVAHLNIIPDTLSEHGTNYRSTNHPANQS
jgi:hypothetical protein